MCGCAPLHVLHEARLNQLGCFHGSPSSAYSVSLSLGADLSDVLIPLTAALSSEMSLCSNLEHQTLDVIHLL